MCPHGLHFELVPHGGAEKSTPDPAAGPALAGLNHFATTTSRPSSSISNTKAGSADESVIRMSISDMEQTRAGASVACRGVMGPPCCHEDGTSWRRH